MKRYNNYGPLVWLLLVTLLNTSCKKEFLDAPPDKSLLVPTTLKDFQAILDNTGIMNLSPEIGLIASDDYYTTNEGLLGSGTQTEQGSYLWASNVYQGESVSDWVIPYQQIFYSNVVLDGLKGTPESEASGSKAIKGAALYYRALAYYNLSQLFTKPYDAGTVGADLGLPIRSSADVNEKSVRSTLKQTYDYFLNDLGEAVRLLPTQVAIKSRPGKCAAYALLARIYLSMSVYDKAGAYADSALQINGKLNNYTNYNPADYRPFPVALPDQNDEIIFYTPLLSYAFDGSPLTFADSTLYRSYDDHDLRKSLYFIDQGLGGVNFQGSYSGNYYLFGGLATDEVYLIRAEASARAGNTDLAAKDLNTLLETRFQAGSYIPFKPTSNLDMLVKVLTERRKELFSRGLRWSDLRRLNKDPLYAVTLKRRLAGQAELTLLPGDNRYVFPIPDDEIRQSGIAQNER